MENLVFAPTLFPTILAVWLCSYFIFVGIGSLFDTSVSASTSFWIGIFTTTLFLHIWHFFAPVTWHLLLFLSFIGAVGIFRRRLRNLPLRYLLVSLPILVFLVNQASLSFDHIEAKVSYDTGLYHLQHVMWNTTYAIVPGLANLHDRFGFNSSFLLFSSLFESFTGGARHYAIGVLFLPILLDTLQALHRLIQRRNTIAEGLQVILIAPVLVWIGYRAMGTFYPDFAVLLIGITLSVRFMHIVETDTIQREDFILIVLLSALGVTFKLSFVVFAFAMVVLTLIRYRYLLTIRSFILLFAVTSAIALTWMARNIVLSGYPLFPSTIAPFDFDWRFPPDEANITATAVYAWARSSGTTATTELASLDWIPRWLTTVSQSTDLIIALRFMGIAIVLSIASRLKGIRRNWIYFVPFACALAYWFLTAPDPRFGLVPLFGFPAGIFVIVVQRWQFRPIIYLLTILLLLFGASNFIQLRLTWTPTQTLVMPSAVRVQLPSGLVINTPSEGDRCFSLPLPCVALYPYTQNLSMRTHDIKDGFRNRTLQP
jgi:hypothetical protein